MINFINVNRILCRLGSYVLFAWLDLSRVYAQFAAGLLSLMLYLVIPSDDGARYQFYGLPSFDLRTYTNR